MSQLYSLKLPDWLKALVIAVLGAVINTIYQAVMDGGVSSIDWTAVGGIALTTALAYLVKNFFSDQKGAVLGMQATASKPPTGD